MTIQEIKKISIREFLASLWIYPKKSSDRYGMYLSPLRSERTPSFKVDYDLNLWYDHGLGEGGSIIDLVMKMDGCDPKAAIERLKGPNYSKLPTT